VTNKKQERKARKLAEATKAVDHFVAKSGNEAEANVALSQFAAGKRKQDAAKSAKGAGAGAATASAMAKLPRLPRKSKDKPLHPCECGCPGTTKSKFCPGHDGRPRGWMLRVDRGVVKLAAIPDGERQVVEKLLRERDGDGAIDQLIAAEAAAPPADEPEQEDESDSEQEDDDDAVGDEAEPDSEQDELDPAINQ
jgi:hypothetical protein